MLTELAFILDRSGSMQSLRQAAIDGFNEFLRDQQANPDQVRLTLVLFDNEILTVHDALPVAEILPLDEERFVPRGSTALLDAIGDTIDRLGARFAAAPESQRPGHVSVAILTDAQWDRRGPLVPPRREAGGREAGSIRVRVAARS